IPISRPSGTATTNEGNANAGHGNGWLNWGGGQTPTVFAFANPSDYTGSTTITTSNISEISFVQGNTAAINFRAAVLIDEVWYVSASKAGTVVDAGADFLANPVKVSFTDFSSATWSVLSFTPGSALS